MTSSATLKNILVFLLINIISFIIHYISNYTNTTGLINIPVSYSVNALLSLSICFLVYLLSKDFEAQIGFIFLGLSVLKMLILFFVLNPTNALGEVETQDALSLFIPFGINLIMEQLFIAKLLKISDLAKNFKN